MANPTTNAPTTSRTAHAGLELALAISAGAVFVGGGVAAPPLPPLPPPPLDAASTVIEPVICGWIAQWYGNEPAVLNVTVFEAPVSSVPVSNAPPSAVAVCGISSEFVQVTVSPTVTVTVGGEKVDPEIPTA